MIYTYIGPVLVVFNPFKWLSGKPADHVKACPIYSDAWKREYVGKASFEVKPHIFSTASAAYSALTDERSDQVIIISGESGAGKTECAKQIMEFVAHVSPATTSAIKRVSTVLLQSNVMLEAFGNAMTVRNNNSSRFGKYSVLEANFKGEVIGASTEQYLLEKSRVVQQAEGERNFHVFYNLMAGKPAGCQLEGKTCATFDYLANDDKHNAIFDDAKEFKDMLASMAAVGIPEDRQAGIFRLLSAILHLGNVAFEPSGPHGDSSAVAGGSAAWRDACAALLRVGDTGVLDRALTFRTINVGGGRGRGRSSIHQVPLDVAQAVVTRDTLARALYHKLFKWIVEHVNDTIGCKDTNAVDMRLGILDIYGFEIFENNAFEQLCINYVNEKLQQIFIQLTLKAEQDEYAAEGAFCYISAT